MDCVTQKIVDAASRFPSIKQLRLFGSRARGDATERSDYDIAVFGASDRDRIFFTDAVDELPILQKIDLVFVSERLKKEPIFRSIQNEGILIMDKFSIKLENFSKAVARLREAVDLSNTHHELVIRDGVIQRFEFTTELAWKTAREYLLLEGETDINSPKPVMRTAFRVGLIDDSENWAQLLNDRNVTSHVYDDETADEIYQRIRTVYVGLFESLLEKLTVLSQKEKL